MTDFDPRSLVGMTSGARKRAARFEARSREEFFGVFLCRATRRWILNLWHLGNNSHDPKKLNRMIHFAGEDPNRVNDAEYARGHIYAKVRAKYRVGERLKSCPNCMKCWPWTETLEGDLVAALAPPKGASRRYQRLELDDICDGSGVIITRIRCPSDSHFLIAERRWIPVPTCRLCMGCGVVKYPLDRTGPKCPGCCNCVVGVCKKLDPDGFCGEEYMHCTDGVIPIQERT